ncbi:GIN domain-containing protein [Rhodophyticola sp.]|jgi:hypothetical protein|uniref:GIN domain-containing protein n=1 Tax=Rhodophyticola sp. TaxID=2680032 RepID=UPI003D2AFB1B
MFMRLSLGAAAAIMIAGSAVAEDRVFEVKDFTQVEVAEGIVATLREGPFRVEATARRGDIDRLVIEQDGDVLRIERETPWLQPSLNDRDRFEVDIQMPVLSRIVSRSGSAVTAAVPVTERFEAQAQSGASLDIEGVEAEQSSLRAASGARLQFEGAAGQTDVQVQSGATMQLAGNCTDLNADVRAGARLDAGAFECHTLSISARAGASALGYADQSASVQARAGASVRVLGNPATRTTDGGVSASIRFE